MIRADSSRYFELVGGTHSKFWEVSRSGRKLSVRFGRIGSDGSKKVKSLASSKEAANAVAKLIREKTAKGYVEKKQRRATTRAPKSIFERLSNTWAEKRAGFELSLRKGATRAELAAFEKKIGRRLPKSFVSFYAWHDGAKDEHAGFEGAYGVFRLSRILSHRKMLEEVRADDGTWSSAFVPFLQENYSDLVCLDAKTGEVFEWFNYGGGRRVILAPSFEAWLEAHVALTEAASSLDDWDSVYAAFNGKKAKKIRARVSPGYPKESR